MKPFSEVRKKDKQINEEAEAKEEYQKFFKEKLDEYDVNSPASLSDDKAKEFFDEVQKEWPERKKELNLD